MHTKGVFPLAFALTLAACRGDALPDRLLQWSTGRQDHAVVEGVNVSVTINSVGVSGFFPMPTPCYNLEPDLDGDRDLLLTITANGTGGACVTMPAYFYYIATMGTFKAGTYNLTIKHRGRGERIVYDSSFTIR